MNIFYNAEYTGLNEDADLISMGFVAETGQKLYIEFLDVPEYLASDYAISNVYPHTYFYSGQAVKGAEDAEEYNYSYFLTCKGHADTILMNWFKALLTNENDRIQLISYCSHYDFCLFSNLFRGKFPANIINPMCYDLFYTVMKHNQLFNKSTPLYERVAKMLSCDPENFAIEDLSLNAPGYPKQHSLYFAELIKQIYDKLECVE